jgi:hypothetical protein
MPNCSGNCATEQTALGPAGTTNPGVGFIFRGGDTWHFGNSSASPYTGGTYTNNWSGFGTGSNTSCQYEGVQTGCFYIGIDTTWFNSAVCGSTWCRPIWSGDNPTATSLVSSCAYGNVGPNNVFLNTTAQNGVYIDGIEFTGGCTNGSLTATAGNNDYITVGFPNSSNSIMFKNNLYLHGWTVTTAAYTAANPANGGNGQPCYMMAGGFPEVVQNLVDDQSDIVPGVCADWIFPWILHLKDSIFRYGSNIATSNYCHDIHDNIFEHFAAVTNDMGHGNLLECNNVGNVGPAEVFYNNIVRHQQPSFSIGGEVLLWFCPNTTPEYWFNNLVYDAGGAWDYAGPPAYPGCPLTGGQYMFNNTLVDLAQPCYVPGIAVGGSYLTVYNEHLINSSGNWFDGSGTTGACTGGPASPTNVTMTDTTATSQGYTTGSAGTDGTVANTCANDTTTPCAPTASTNGTVGMGTNFQSYCTTLANYSGDIAINRDAANACKYGTTDACTYNETTHTMVCPGQTAIARPTSTAWDAGAYQYCPPGQCTQTPPPPVTTTTSSFAPQVYPNPWRSDRGYAQQVTFALLTGNTTLKIFTVSGHLIKTLNTSNASVTWDLTNDSGDKVASGIYLYLITDSQGDKVKGKVAVIK